MGTLLPVSMFGTGPVKGDVYAYSQSVTLLGLSPSPVTTTHHTDSVPRSFRRTIPNQTMHAATPHRHCSCTRKPPQASVALLTQCGDFSVEPVVLPAGRLPRLPTHSHRGHRALDHQLGGDTIYSHSELLALDSAGPGPCSRLLLEIRSRVVDS